MSEVSLVTEKHESDPISTRIWRAGRWAGKIVVATALVGMTASVFVNRWIDNFADQVGNKVEPVTGSLDQVNQRTGDLTVTVENGIPQLTDKLGGLQSSVDSLNPESTTTTLPLEATQPETESSTTTTSTSVGN